MLPENHLQPADSKTPPTPGEVYAALAAHQQTATAGWDLEQLIKVLHRWKEIYVTECKLELPRVAFCLKHTTSLCYGYYRPAHNEFGMTREIAINRAYLDCREHWQVLGTLLHELLHAWQDLNGKPGKRNYHNKQFCEKAEGWDCSSTAAASPRTPPRPTAPSARFSGNTV